MRPALVLVMTLSVASCDRVLGLERDTTCPYIELAPDADDDRDSLLNGVDDCPLVPGHDPHDEDGDGVPDDCDLCPMFEEAGADRDCDGIGAACDSDDSVPHVREFFGFGSERGLELSDDAAVAGDALQFRFAGLEAYGRAMVAATVPGTASYELQSMLTVIGDGFCRHGFVIVDATPPAYQVPFSVYQGNGVLRITRGNGLDTITLASMDVGAVGATLEVLLRLEIVGTTLTARVTGPGIRTTEATATVPVLSEVVQYGVAAYCDTEGAASTFDSLYMVRTAIAP